MVNGSRYHGLTGPGPEGQLRFVPGEMPPAFGDTAAALIVDDDPAVAGVLARLLEREGYHCTLAADAAEARAHLAEGEFAIALVDVMMPGESGLELVAHMLVEDRDLAAIMVSGVDHPSIAELASLSGAYGYLIKPFQPNQVLITVSNAGYRRCLEILRRRYESQLLGELERHAGDGTDRSRPGVGLAAPGDDARVVDGELDARARQLAHELVDALSKIDNSTATIAAVAPLDANPVTVGEQRRNVRSIRRRALRAYNLAHELSSLLDGHSVR